MTELILKTFDALDPSGANSAKYAEMFGRKMSDKEFETFFKKYFYVEKDTYMTWDIVDFERPALLANIEKALKVIDVPAEEDVIMPFENMSKENPVVSKDKCIVGYLHLKRMQQIASKKNSMSIDNSDRDPITNQVRGSDKNATETDTEVYGMISIGGDAIIRELMGPRADDAVMKNQMLAQIARKGYVSQKELTNNIANKTTLRLIDWYYTGMMLKTDLVTKSYATIKTLNED